jgi:hypothetical protein
MKTINRHFLAASIFVVGAALAYPLTANGCWRQTERQAIAVRVLQSEITIGALACYRPNEYGEFVNRQQRTLQRHGGALTQYYLAAYGEDEGQRRLDTLVTRLANEASRRKSAWPSGGYCNFITALTIRAAAEPPARLADFAASTPHAQRAMARCD